MKHLAIDCRSISKEKTGVGNVLFNILIRLDLDNVKITLFFDRELNEEDYIFYRQLNYDVKIIKCSNYIIWEQILFPYHIKKEFDYVWFPANTGAIFTRVKTITTIHDVIFDKSIKEIPLSGIISKDLARFYRKFVANIMAKKSIRLYTVSNYSKLDIVKTYGIDENLVKVIYNGLDESFILNKNESVQKEDYILSFGSNEPRKNTELMINVYRELINKYPQFKNTKLVLYGFKNYHKSNIKRIIKNYKLEDNVIIYQYVSDEFLKELYKKSKIFCFLSSFEGFGLPILESMALKTPVIALNNSSIPEIINESGIIINNPECDNIIDAIQELYTNNEEYKQYVERGYTNIKRFSWENSVKQLKKDLKQIILMEIR